MISLRPFDRRTNIYVEFFSDTFNVISVRPCVLVVLPDLPCSIPFLVTLTELQVRSSMKTVAKIPSSKFISVDSYPIQRKLCTVC